MKRAREEEDKEQGPTPSQRTGHNRFLDVPLETRYKKVLEYGTKHPGKVKVLYQLKSLPVGWWKGPPTREKKVSIDRVNAVIRNCEIDFSEELEQLSDVKATPKNLTEFKSVKSRLENLIKQPIGTHRKVTCKDMLQQKKDFTDKQMTLIQAIEDSVRAPTSVQHEQPVNPHDKCVFDDDKWSGSIYLLRKKEFEDENKPIYKLGMTQRRNAMERTDEYPGCKVYGIWFVDNVALVERRLLHTFSGMFERPSGYEFGTEQFITDDVSKMVTEIEKEVDNYKPVQNIFKEKQNATPSIKRADQTTDKEFWDMFKPSVCTKCSKDGCTYTC